MCRRFFFLKADGSDDAATAGSGNRWTLFALMVPIAAGTIAGYRIGGAACTYPGHGQDGADVGSERLLERLRCHQGVVVFLMMIQRLGVDQRRLDVRTLYFHRAAHQAFYGIGDVM